MRQLAKISRTDEIWPGFRDTPAASLDSLAVMRLAITPVSLAPCGLPQFIAANRSPGSPSTVYKERHKLRIFATKTISGNMKKGRPERIRTDDRVLTLQTADGYFDGSDYDLA